ncbi:MAG: MerR family transcriptional regulator [Chitinophagaceae bacterium]|nr:MerR family transcriptional regulator [Chitinophagaceae bacterium]
MPFTIKDIENLTGIKAHTIRIWEQRYSFLKPKRSATNIRSYTNEDLKIILNISFLNKYGFKISHINKMSEKVMNEKIISLTSLEAKQEKTVNDLIEKMVDVDMDQFEALIDKYIFSSGIEKAILLIIFPFLEKIGILWLTNNINPAQEHLVSNIIRQKILVGIESIKTILKSNKKICLFLPEGEYHELCLLFIAYLLKKQGLSVVYLGASIPMKDVEFIVYLKKPDFLYTHLTTAGKNFNFNNFISNVSKRFDELPIIVSGKLTHVYQKKIPSNITFKKSLNEVIEFVESL